MIYLYEETKQLTDHQLFLLERMLPNSLRKRADKIENKKARMERMVGYALLSTALIEKYRWEKEEIFIENGIYGKPFLSLHPKVFFNLSHSDGRAVCVVGEKENGIDLQKRIPFQERFKKFLCCEEERQRVDSCLSTMEKEWTLTKIWAAKEAYLKKKGTGIRQNLCLLCTEEEESGDYLLKEEKIHFWKRGDFVMALCAEETEKILDVVTLERLQEVLEGHA